MSDENDDAQNDSDGIKNLRKQYESQAKENGELRKQLEGFLAKERTTSVAGVLKAKGLSEKAAKFYTGEDVSEEAVGKWLEENAEVFGVKQEQNQNPGSDPNALAAQRLSQAAGGAQDPITNAPGNQQIIGDPAEIERLIRTAPYEELVKLGYMPDVTGTLYDTHGR